MSSLRIEDGWLWLPIYARSLFFGKPVQVKRYPLHKVVNGKWEWYSCSRLVITHEMRMSLRDLAVVIEQGPKRWICTEADREWDADGEHVYPTNWHEINMIAYTIAGGDMAEYDRLMDAIEKAKAEEGK